MARRRAVTPEEREKQLVSEAMNLAERQIREGTASSQVILHFLRMGSMREKVEREKLGCEVDLLAARRESLERETNMEEVYREAVEAMKRYGGHYNDG